eukprot:gene17282-35877_t
MPWAVDNGKHVFYAIRSNRNGCNRTMDRATCEEDRHLPGDIPGPTCMWCEGPNPY